MKASKLMLTLLIIACVSLTSCSKDSTDYQVETLDIPDAPVAKLIEIEIMELINAHRISVGLPALVSNNTVKAVAFTHTDYMIEVNEVSHANFITRKQTLQVNANANRVSENVAYGFNSANAVVNAWLNSEGHRENIEGDYNEFEISAEQNEAGRWYFTNMFIKR